MSLHASNIRLFNKTAFKHSLKSADSPLALYKKTLQDGYTYLKQEFCNGTDIETLVGWQVYLIDNLLIHAWWSFVDQNNYCLVAVGGYGREELMLASDIDLMILESPQCNKDSKQRLEQFLVFLWDFGLEVGHSVRTVKVCRTEAKKDITVITNVMESRYLAGNQDLFEEMLKVISPAKIWPLKKFFEAKLLEQEERHRKFNDYANKLEPNIKETPGGLRDIQMIGWVIRREFNSIDIKMLVKKRILTRDEFKALINGRNFLWQVRFALHMINGRREDRLLFDSQRQIAELLGFRGSENKGIEAFMKIYFKTIRDMGRLNEMLLQHFQETILYSQRREKIVPVNSRFQKRNDFIEVKNRNIFKEYPSALMEIFLLLQHDPKIKGVRASTIRLIRNNLHLINGHFRRDLANRTLFMEIITQPLQVGHKLRQMHCYGVLGAYLPVFAKIEGLMQFDMFHVYTVDEHTLRVIQNMRRLGLDESKADFPLCNEIINNKLPKRELLYLAGLFHDIAKGRGGDHSRLGAKDAIDFCKRHSLSDYDARLVGWLVEAHLLMSRTAQREDIDDPGVIHQFADKVRDETHLNYLHVLTVADICATNPKLWNGWKGALLSSLYRRTLRELRRGKEKPILKKKRILNIKDAALHTLEDKGLSEDAVKYHWKSFQQDYFLRHSEEEIVWHMEGILKHRKTDEPLIRVKSKSGRGGSLIFLHMKDRDNVFAITTKLIEQIGLNVLDAKIISSKTKYTLDTYVVLENDGELISGRERIAEIVSRLNKALRQTDKLPEYGNLVENRQTKTFTMPTEVIFHDDKRNNWTIMEVITIDRPGVLSRIGSAMAQSDVKLLGARIATLGERVEDLFYIRNRDNSPIESPKKIRHLEKSIQETLAAG